PRYREKDAQIVPVLPLCVHASSLRPCRQYLCIIGQHVSASQANRSARKNRRPNPERGDITSDTKKDVPRTEGFPARTRDQERRRRRIREPDEIPGDEPLQRVEELLI